MSKIAQPWNADTFTHTSICYLTYTVSLIKEQTWDTVKKIGNFLIDFLNQSLWDILPMLTWDIHEEVILLPTFSNIPLFLNSVQYLASLIIYSLYWLWFSFTRITHIHHSTLTHQLLSRQKEFRYRFYFFMYRKTSYTR